MALYLGNEKVAGGGNGVIDNLESTSTTDALSSNMGRILNENKLDKSNLKYFEWTPELSCQTASEAPTVTYTSQIGHGTKIKISDEISIVFITFYIRGTITAVSSGNNYATIAGLPYLSSLNGGYSNVGFSRFYKGIADEEYVPLGFFAGKTIRIQNSTPPYRGANVAQWVVNTTGCQIDGSGFYFTKE